MTNTSDDPYSTQRTDRVVDASAFRLDGRVAVVIGGTGTLCANMAETLAFAGARTVIVGRDATKAAAVLARIEVRGGAAAFERCDVTSSADLRSLVTQIVTTHQRIDVLVNGAGVNSAPLTHRLLMSFSRISPASRSSALGRRKMPKDCSNLPFGRMTRSCSSSTPPCTKSAAKFLMASS